jgi:hypothetical protein
MIGNQGPCIKEGARVLEYPSQPLRKLFPISIATEYLPPFDAPGHDVVQGTSSID